MSGAEFNIEKQVARWREGALLSWDDALYLLKGKRIMLGMFAVHLSLEKAVKAHVVRQTGKMPPKIHNLTRLAEIAELELNVDHKQVLAEINDFNIQGRYSEMLPAPITLSEAKRYLRKAKGTLEWLIGLL